MSSSLHAPFEADYVIVGGGTSGLVLASRLSENDSTRSVIVLEAGKNLIDDPRAALNNRVIKEPQGKVLGGSSGINGQAFIAPTKAGIDAWNKLGATGWTWENLAPYYKKATTLQLPDEPTRNHLGSAGLILRSTAAQVPSRSLFLL
ncbi:hypothetical protein AnigIFM63309_011244 [Aspergillus niger]|nr:hypothetical protein AnigIFM63309_011244 [Aspergillus niger]